jgi:translation initiation factor 3 subunit L
MSLLRLDPIFLILYRELYYRHVYSRLQPNLDDRFHSYENSCELFNYLLSMRIPETQSALCPKSVLPDSDGPVTLELPEQWLWDIVDEFIYQYQSFSVWRSKAGSKTEEELTSLGDGGQVCHKKATKALDLNVPSNSRGPRTAC